MTCSVAKSRQFIIGLRTISKCFNFLLADAKLIISEPGNRPDKWRWISLCIRMVRFCFFIWPSCWRINCLAWKHLLINLFSWATCLLLHFALRPRKTSPQTSQNWRQHQTTFTMQRRAQAILWRAISNVYASIPNCFALFNWPNSISVCLAPLCPQQKQYHCMSVCKGILVLTSGEIKAAVHHRFKYSFGSGSIAKSDAIPFTEFRLVYRRCFVAANSFPSQRCEGTIWIVWLSSHEWISFKKFISICWNVAFTTSTICVYAKKQKH